MTVINWLKKADRALLELHTGMLLTGLLCQLVGAFFVENQAEYAKSLWFGVLFALAGSIHIARTLDRALECGEGAQKVIIRGYVFRYVMVAAIMAVIAVTEVMNPLVVFLGYMTLKAAAYLQPMTHKFYNRLFHETDPVPTALPEEAPEGKESKDET